MTWRRRAPRAASLALGVSLTLTACFLSSQRDADLEIADGPLRGVVENGVRSWLGIPYAAPPVDDLRWQPPQPPAPWSKTLDADSFQSQCLQMLGQHVAPKSSEDCLYLNVFRPDTDEQDLPVMVWLHGGALVLGNGDLEPDTVSGLVEQDVVVVSLNYRLGRLGYFAHPALADEGEKSVPIANFGLLDQIAALRWVQDNIQEFGGDPGEVTLFGSSAGSASVNYLMSSPLARGLFARAISSSGLGREQPPTWAAAAAQGEHLVASLGPRDADAEALRELDPDAVAALPAHLLLDQIPILDAALPSSPADTFARGREAAVPYLVGSTGAELPDPWYPMLGIDPVAVRAEYASGREAELDAAYGDDQTVRDQHFLADLFFTEPARRLAEWHADRAPTFRFRFEIAAEESVQAYGGALHGSEVPFVFGSETEVAQTVAGAPELAATVSDCWVSFAKTGTPRCGGVDWPEADQGLLEFTNEGPVATAVDPWQARLDLVEQIRQDGGLHAG